jgi:hypothetical protein
VIAMTKLAESRILTRRGLLRNTALATIALPVLRKLEAFGAAASPRRVILLFSPNGPMTASGPAAGTETAFTLHDWWKPLERHRAEGIFLSHMASTGGGVVTSGGHGLGGQVFCGHGGGYNGDQYRSKGPSIDQLIGQRLESEGRAGIRRSLVWGVGSSGGNGAFVAAPGRHITPEVDPSKAWADIFASFVAPAAGDAAARRAAALIARDQSVLDFLNDDCSTLKTALGAEGARLLDDHCTTLRSFERNLAAGLNANTTAGRCAKPARPATMSWTNPENIDLQTSTFIDLIAATLACELSHVIGFQFSSQAARNRLAVKYGVPSSPTADSGDSGPAHHPWTHQGPSEAKQTAMQIFQTFYSTQVAALVDKLKTTVDAYGKPLIDSTLVVWASELGGSEKNRDGHQTGSQPVVVFGRGQGVFKTGRYIHGKSPDSAYNSNTAAYQEAGRDMARLLVSVMQYMGLADVTTVGATGVKGPLTALYA